jgi:hypothetical membrane protein
VSLAHEMSSQLAHEMSAFRGQAPFPVCRHGSHQRRSRQTNRRPPLEFRSTPPRISFSQQSASMLGTHFWRHPWIFNVGSILTGFAALGAALGLYRVFLRKSHFLLSLLIGLSVACTGVVCLKGGMFPLPDPRHSSWNFLLNYTIITPHLMLIGLWKRSHSSGLRTYLICSVTFLFLLAPLTSWLGRGTFSGLLLWGRWFPSGSSAFSSGGNCIEDQFSPRI